MPLEQVYAPDIRFEDPFHRLDGLEALRRYFERLNSNLEVGRFRFGEELRSQDGAMLTWTAHLELRRGPKRPIVVDGVSHLRFTERVTFQRDYVDGGALVYEHLPV